MNTDSIAEVGIDEQGRLYLRPTTATFPYIYREGVEVHWEPTRCWLYSPKPREWTYLKWFQHIIGAAAMQAHRLNLTPSTVWTNISPILRDEMQNWFSSSTSAMS